MKASTQLVKIALRREEGYPIGQPAPLYLLCPCGQRLPIKGAGNVTCACGAKYTTGGWVVRP